MWVELGGRSHRKVALEQNLEGSEGSARLSARGRKFLAREWMTSAEAKTGVCMALGWGEGSQPEQRSDREQERER